MLKNKFPLDLQRVSKKYADAYLTTKEAADDEVLSVHRVLLASLSPKLGELFEETESKKGERIVVRNVRFEVLSAIVDFVYSGQIDVELKGAEFIEDFKDGLNMLKIEIGEKASGKLGEELKKLKEAEKLRKAKAIEDAKELRKLEKKLEMLRKQNDLVEMGRKRSGSDDTSDENLNKKKPLAGEMTAHKASKTKETSGAGMKTSPSSCSRIEERIRCKGEATVKQERQESWEPSDLEESYGIRSVLHEKQKQEIQAKERESSSSSKRSVSKMRLRTESRETRDKNRDMAAVAAWESAAARLRSAHDSRDMRSYEPQSRDSGRYSRSDFGEYGRERNMWEKRGREDGERGQKWLKWNFEPRRNPEPDPNWPRQMQAKIGPLPGHVSREKLEYAVREVGALKRLFLQHSHTDFRPTETRYAYVVFREPSAALRLLKSACIQVDDDYFKAGPMEERS